MSFLFSLGLHTQHFSKKDHLDLFLETALDNSLVHFYSEINYRLQDLIRNKNELIFKKKSSFKWLKGKPHSQKYLDYTGYLSDSKGYLEHLFKGNYTYQDASILHNNNIQCLFIKFKNSIRLYIS